MTDHDSVENLEEAAKRWLERFSEKERLREAETVFPIVLKMLAGSKQVLDIGCGDGWSTQFLSKLGDVSIHAGDINPYLLKLAREKLPMEVAVFPVVLGKELKLKSNSYDGILAKGVLQHLNDGEIDTTFRELYRILSPGGKFVAVTVHPLWNIIWTQSDTLNTLERFSSYMESKEILVGARENLGTTSRRFRRPVFWYSQRLCELGFKTESMEIKNCSDDNRHGFPLFVITKAEKSR